MAKFSVLAYSPIAHDDACVAIAGSRAGAVGVFDAIVHLDGAAVLQSLADLVQYGRGDCGIRLPFDPVVAAAVLAGLPEGIGWVVIAAERAEAIEPQLETVRSRGVKVLLEITQWDKCAFGDRCDGIIVKGHESAGVVGEETSFIMLQKAVSESDVPVWVHGGVGLHSAAACFVAGARGVVLDSQLLLTRESPVAERLAPIVKDLVGTETVALEAAEQNYYFRVLDRPGYRMVKALRQEAQTLSPEVLVERCLRACGWEDPTEQLVPVGQDIAFATSLAARFHTVGGIVTALQRSVRTYIEVTARHGALEEGSPLAQSLGTRYPIVQGPMTRVSDSSAFAAAVAEAGALPVLALALQKGPQVVKLLAETSEQVHGYPWGIGVLGFAPSQLLAEQIAASKTYKPSFVIIAGGRPDQALELEKEGIPCFLHVPSPRLLAMFVEEGARRFIFEGRECGGHIGPLSSFVLWDSMVDQLLASARDETVARNTEVLFAGGIHDRLSAAMVSVLAAPLVERGIKVGILMGTAYLFTKEIVSTGAIVPGFQAEALACTRTVNLESGAGHATRCALTPFAHDFVQTKRRLQAQREDPEEIRETLEELSLGRLRVASKGKERRSEDDTLVEVDLERQRNVGQYMIGQVASLRSQVTDLAGLHREVTDKASRIIRKQAIEARSEGRTSRPRPSDVAVIGIGTLFPQAKNAHQYWENILDRVDAITEIPRHRWDWRLYFDADRSAKDKIYSKWGGFLDDMPFDPIRYGMPPNSVEYVDPLQLMTLEVVRQTLEDAGYMDREFDGERTSVIIGASGGAGDVGMQYGLRSELPRFQGNLPEDIGDRLPTWSEDTFAGILLNVAAGRVSNRFNFGGVNFTVDAACASSLAAVYQAVTELEDGRSDLVIVGGADAMQGPFAYLCFSKTQALSPTGTCRTFDANADGIVISEGIAMVALKRLADAERDGDRIYAVIKGVGGSSDGRAKGLTAPLPDGQLRAVNRAYDKAGYSPSTVRLFEAHGTGTVAGDTAELETTTRLLRNAGVRPRQAVVGSVKTMIGHTKAAAGVAGLTKMALALKYKVLPPHTNVTEPNVTLRSPECPLYLVREAQPWVASSEHPRRASVSAFGFGGTNFHAALEEYTGGYPVKSEPAPRTTWSHELLLWNRHADLPHELIALRTSLQEGAGPELRDLAFSLYSCWTPGEPTLAVVAGGLEQLRERLDKVIPVLLEQGTEIPPGVHLCDDPLAVKGKVAALFSGQGSQYPEMLRELAVLFPEIVEPLAEADRIYRETASHRPDGPQLLSYAIYPPGRFGPQDEEDAKKTLMRTDVAQPALGAIEVGLWGLLTRRFGFVSHMAAGHSYGEYTALYTAGVFDFGDLIRLSEARGRFIVGASVGGDPGGMVAVQAQREEVERIAAAYPDVTVANHNAPSQTILAGGSTMIDTVVTKLSEAGYAASRLPVAAAFHSPFVASAADALREFMDGVPFAPPKLPVYSNTTAAVYGDDPSRIRANLCEQLSRPVEFVAEIESMYEAGARLFVEIGPKGVLSRLVGLILGDRPHLSVSFDGGIAAFLNALGALVAHGLVLDLSHLFAGRDCRRIDPANPTGAEREQPIPPHAWMVNGSGVGRAGGPMRGAGVTLEQSRERRQAPQEAQRHEAVSPTIIDSMTRVPGGPRLEANRMPGVKNVVTDQDYRETAEDRQPILESYFETMRQFILTQEAVMTAYLGASPSGRRRSFPVRPAQRPALLHPPIETVRPDTAPELPAHTTQAQSATAEPVSQISLGGGQTTVEPPPGPIAPATSSPGQPAVDPQAPVPAGSKEFDRDDLAQQVLQIVEDRTGYPRDMIGMDQNMEADLGIDSIKRVEIASVLIKALPEEIIDRLGADRDQINTQKTLNGIVDLIASKGLNGGGAARPFDLTGVGTIRETSAPLPRFVMRAQPEPVREAWLGSLGTGAYVITEDSLGVAERLAAALRREGASVRVLSAHALLDPMELEREAASVTEVTGLVHLAPLGDPPLSWDAGLEEFKARVERNEKSLFRLMQLFADGLSRGKVITASGLGGYFARDGSRFNGVLVQGGAVGLIKSAREEWPELQAKAIDLDPEQPVQALTEQLLGELRMRGGRLEVGYPRGQRTIFRTERVPAAETALLTPSHDWVVLATGGARGITAEVLSGLATKGMTMILTGRTPLPTEESEETAGLSGEAELRAYFVAKVRGATVRPTPMEIQRQVDAVLRDREIRANVRAMDDAGAQVLYEVVDVRDEGEMAALFERIYARFGHLDGVVHGAGVIEDRLIADKTPESWSRVVDTKVGGLFLIARHVRPDSLKFLVAFGSVAGRYGNSGQADYATANELMNRMACQLQSRWTGRVKIVVTNWGPWGPTRHGKGMVTPETEQKFAVKGVSLVFPELGRDLFLGEIVRGPRDQVEIIHGEGPWEVREGEVGRLQMPFDAPESPVFPLLHGTHSEIGPRGEQILHHTFSLDRDRYLDHHRMDGVPVVPAAVALELIAEAAAIFWPRWQVNSVSDFRLLKGMSLGDNGSLPVLVSGMASSHGDATGLEVAMEIRSAGDNPLRHYRAVVHLGDVQLESAPFEWTLMPARSTVTSHQAYSEYLFHGSRFQTIAELVDLDESGAVADVNATMPGDWVAGAQDTVPWLFDPGIVDSGPQMSIIWSCVVRDQVALPNRIGRVTRFHRPPATRYRMYYSARPGTAHGQVLADVAFVDPEGYLVLMLDAAEGTSSGALNRLRGQWSGTAEAMPYRDVEADPATVDNVRICQ